MKIDNMRNNTAICDIEQMKRLKIENVAQDVREWIGAKEGRTVEKFAQKAGVSKRTIELLIAGDYNPSLEKLNSIMNALGGFEMYYTPPHEIE